MSTDYETQTQAKAWRALYDRLLELDPTLREVTGVTGTASALASLDRLVGQIPALRDEVARLTLQVARLEAYRDIVMDGNAVWEEVRTRLDAVGTTPATLAAVLDAVARLAKRATPDPRGDRHG